MGFVVQVSLLLTDWKPYRTDLMLVLVVSASRSQPSPTVSPSSHRPTTPFIRREDVFEVVYASSMPAVLSVLSPSRPCWIRRWTSIESDAPPPSPSFTCRRRRWRSRFGDGIPWPLLRTSSAHCRSRRHRRPRPSGPPCRRGRREPRFHSKPLCGRSCFASLCLQASRENRA